MEFITNKMKNIKCEYRKMFGYPAYFINGNMFAGLFDGKLYLKLSEQDTAELKKENEDAGNLEPMPGRPMKSYVTIPKSLYSNDALFAEWLKKSFSYVSTLPPKKKK